MEARESQETFLVWNHLDSNSLISSQLSGISVKCPICGRRMVRTRERNRLATEAHSGSEFLLCAGGGAMR